MITDAQLAQVMPNLSAAKRALYLPYLVEAMQAHGIDNALRSAAFIAQLAHESGEFRWMEEIWGPTAAQKRYEPPNDLARNLGNTQPGDGARFKGRGPIQITGRSNYQRYGSGLGLDLIANPPLAATPEVAFKTAGLYWKTNGLNELADQQDFVKITRRINGGINGLEDRQKYYDKACAVLGVTAATREGPPAMPMPRGFEAIAVDASGRPAPRKTSAKKAAPKKAAAKKGAAKKGAAKKAAGKTASKKVASKKAASKKAASKKVASKKVASKKASAKKAASKKMGAKQAPAKKATGKKAAAKKATAKKAGAKKAAAKK